jgi:hypothetical protein
VTLVVLLVPCSSCWAWREIAKVVERGRVQVRERMYERVWESR